MTLPTKPTKSATAAAPATDTIGFRLEAEPRRILDERAAKLGVSPHALARHYVMEVLAEPEERAALRQAVQALSQSVARTHESLALGVEALLCSAGRVEEDKARAWVDLNFKSPC